MIGQTVSHYRIVEKLGGGGMGVVYRAEDTKLLRSVALKFLPPELTRDDDAKRRFVQEAQAASALDHPNICTTYEIDETPEGQLFIFIAMAYYPGETSKKKIERGPLKLDEVLDYAMQIAQGLVKAHAAGIVHRHGRTVSVLLLDGGPRFRHLGDERRARRPVSRIACPTHAARDRRTSAASSTCHEWLSTVGNVMPFEPSALPMNWRRRWAPLAAFPVLKCQAAPASLGARSNSTMPTSASAGTSPRR